MSGRCVYCPECGRKLASFFIDGTMPQMVYCKECTKQVVWNPVTGTIVAKTKKIHRNTSSGITFW